MTAIVPTLSFHARKAAEPDGSAVWDQEIHHIVRNYIPVFCSKHIQTDTLFHRLLKCFGGSHYSVSDPVIDSKLFADELYNLLHALIRKWQINIRPDQCLVGIVLMPIGQDQSDSVV